MKRIWLVLSLALTAVGCSKTEKADKAPLPEGTPDGFLLTDPSYKSGERLLVEAAIAQAKAEGKRVLVDFSGAWCPDCVILKKGIAAAAPEQKAVLDGFVFVELEDLAFELLQVVDFLPFTPPVYPSLVAFDPATGLWTHVGTPADFGSFVDALKHYQANGSVLGYYEASYAAWHASGESLDVTWRETPTYNADGRFGSYLFAITTALSRDDMFARLNTIADHVLAEPKRYRDGSAFFGRISYVLIPAVSDGRLTQEEATAFLTALYDKRPSKAADAEKAATEARDFLRTITFSFGFDAANSRTMFTQGPEAAAAACAQHSAAVGEQTNVFFSAAMRDATCATLAQRVGVATEGQVAAALAGMNDEKFHVLTRLGARFRLFLALGDTANATTTVEEYNAAFVKRGDESTDSLTKKVAEATDPTTKANLEKRLAFSLEIRDNERATFKRLIEVVRAGSTKPIFDMAKAK